jgi:hypothetical protein
MAKAGAREWTMAGHYFPVAASPESANFVHRQNTCEGDAGYLAGIAFDRIGRLFPPNIEHRAYYFCARAERSYTQDLHWVSFNADAGITSIRHAGAISCIDIS